MSKTYQLEFEERKNYLYVHLTGRDSFSASLEYWNTIISRAKKIGAYKVLVHERLEGQVSEGEIFEIMMELVPQGIGFQVAFFDENREDIPINALGQLVASNRGIDVRIFQSLDAATEWMEHLSD